MNRNPATVAWIEVPDRGRVPVVGNLSLGRTPASQIVLADERVSRRHAIVHAQGAAEFWLVDHGSRNGTFVNDRRVLQPVRLRDGDQIRIGPFLLGFHQLSDLTVADTSDPSTLGTLVDLHSAICWLLVADVQGSTALMKSMPPDALAMLLGSWFKRCQELVEARDGTLNKYLGDGFLAFWRNTASPADALRPVIDGLRHLQRLRKPPFRFVLHHGDVFLGGGGALGEDSLSGADVNFVFRLEKVAAELGEDCVLSAAANRVLGPDPTRRPLGNHSVPGFDGHHPLFAF
jgi:adenylate cyclase